MSEKEIQDLNTACHEAEQETVSCCGGRHKKRTIEEQKALLTRLKKVEGQIRGIEKMVENDMYCPDILMQVSAATSYPPGEGRKHRRTLPGSTETHEVSHYSNDIEMTEA